MAKVRVLGFVSVKSAVGAAAPPTVVGILSEKALDTAPQTTTAPAGVMESSETLGSANTTTSASTSLHASPRRHRATIVQVAPEQEREQHDHRK